MSEPRKYRGRRKDNGEWVYGFYTKECVGADGNIQDVITDGDSLFPTQVSPTTVGQFTGLKDKNGKDIYEGDIVKLDTPKNAEHPTRNRAIIFNQDHAQFCIDPCTGIRYWPSVEVVGSIHENPDLLEKPHE